jgi:hypothetical protein
MGRLDGLFIENAEAWQVYQHMCGRTVRDCQLEGWLLDRLTEGWDQERTLALVERLNIIGAALSPTHGPTENRRHR